MEFFESFLGAHALGTILVQDTLDQSARHFCGIQLDIDSECLVFRNFSSPEFFLPERLQLQQ